MLNLQSRQPCLEEKQHAAFVDFVNDAWVRVVGAQKCPHDQLKQLGVVDVLDILCRVHHVGNRVADLLGGFDAFHFAFKLLDFSGLREIVRLFCFDGHDLPRLLLRDNDVVTSEDDVPLCLRLFVVIVDQYCLHSRIDFRHDRMLLGGLCLNSLWSRCFWCLGCLFNPPFMARTGTVCGLTQVCRCRGCSFLLGGGLGSDLFLPRVR